MDEQNNKENLSDNQTSEPVSSFEGDQQTDQEQDQDIKLIISQEGKNYVISGVNLDESVSLSSDQLASLIAEIKDSKFSDKNYKDLLYHIDSLKSTVKSGTESQVEVPEDYYSVMADLEGQQTFFLSLIFGLMIAFCFGLGLKK